MMDSAEERRSRRTLRYAVFGSLFVHVLGFLFYAVATMVFPTLRTALATPTPRPPQVVTLSNALTISKKSNPVPHSQPHPRQPPPQHAAAPVQPHPAVQPRVVTAPEAPKPQVHAPIPHALHELAKPLPVATAEPTKTVKETPPPQPHPEQKVALAPHVPALHAPAQKSAQLSQAQLARIGQDMQQTVAQLHAESNPLNVRSTADPTATKQYHVQMTAFQGDLRGAQGTCYPIKSWVAGNWDYYYESCDVQFDNGRYEVQAVPWPIRYPRGHDLYHGDLGNVKTVPLPPPQPGWKLPQGEKVSDELRRYAHDSGVDI
jgi:hypothetical protein